MNIRGIELLRKLGLPGPKKEIIMVDLSKVDLNELYYGAEEGVTIIVFDYTESINQNPLLEKNVRKYQVERSNFLNVVNELVFELEKKGVKKSDMVFLAHQTYVSENIGFSGRVAIEVDHNGFGKLWIDAVQGLRKANSDFTPEYIYQCPILGGKIFRSGGEIIKNGFCLPSIICGKLIDDISNISGNPNIDFEVYNDGQVFYHDMFLGYY